MAEHPGISPAAAARTYTAGQRTAEQGPQASTGESRTQLGSARTSGNSAAGTRA